MIDVINSARTSQLTGADVSNPLIDVQQQQCMPHSKQYFPKKANTDYDAWYGGIIDGLTTRTETWLLPVRMMVCIAMD
jgi:hypothetical protein